MAIAHVLLDADGVVQHVPGGWYAAIEPYLGERAREFIHGLWKAEAPLIVGQGSYLPFLAAHLASAGVGAPVEEVYRAVWHNIEVSAASVALVHQLRAAGYGVHLGTNQERDRGTYMRDALGYDELFEVSCYSYDLGVAKPSAEFFGEAARRIGADPATIVFIDDTPANVAGARAAGLAAEHWHLDHGHDTLVALLASHGIAI